MNFDNHHEQYTQWKAPRETPRKLVNAIDLMLKLNLRNLEVDGREHLKEIPQDKKVIVVTSHTSDLDIPITIKTLGNDFDFAVTHESVQNDITKDPKAYLVNQLAGQENFMPIQYNIVDGKKVGAFNPDDYSSLKELVENGEKTVLIAAHNPVRNGDRPQPGYGAVYLSQITQNSILLPVSIHLEKGGVVRKDARVEIGQPIELPKIEGIENFSKIIKKRADGQKLSAEDVQDFTRLKDLLKQQSEEVLKTLGIDSSNVEANS